MSQPSIKGVQTIPSQEVQRFEAEYPELGRWLRLVGGALPRVRTYEQQLTPAVVNANAESAQNFTVTGLQTNDVVIVNKPSDTAGISISQVFVSATNTLTIKYRNHTGGNITPAAENYRIVAIRL